MKNLQTKIQKIDPGTIEQIVEGWAGMSSDARKRRAAAASQDIDRAELRSLLESYIFANARAMARTAQNTIDTYSQGTTHLLNWCEKVGIKPHQLDEEKARRFIVSMAALSPKSQQVYRTGARTMIAALRWAGMGEGQPFEKIRIYDPTPRSEKADPYSKSEVDKLLEAASAREKVIVLLAADSGLRLAEVAGLTWANIDYEGQRIKGFMGKGGKQGTVATSKRCLDALADMGSESGEIFGISRRRIQQIFTRLCERAAVNPRGYHSLRHHAGTKYCKARGMTEAQELLRHSDVRTTQIYVTLGKGAIREMIEEMEEAGTL